MTPEQRAAERQQIREAGAKRMREIRAERGPIPEQTLREVIRPALVEATAAMRANRSKRHPA